MPRTYWVGQKANLGKVLPKIKTDWVVLKPFNGLKGIGVFIGPKERAKNFSFSRKYSSYIAQDFIESAGGIKGLVNGRYDLRVVVINAICFL